jgi:hypothetical protein
MNDPKPRKLPLHTSPKGVLVFPKLIVPDTKFDKDGRLGTGLRLSSDAAGPLIATLQPLHNEALEAAEAARAEKVASLPPAKAKLVKPVSVNPFFAEDLDEDGNETGDLMFRFGVKAKGVARKKGKEEVFERKIAIFDARGNMIRDEKLEIWSGSVGRVTFVAVPYYVPATGACGLSLRPVAVQIIDLRTRGSAKSAEAFGFDKEEDGFAYQPKVDLTEQSEPAPGGETPAADDELDY